MISVGRGEPGAGLGQRVPPGRQSLHRQHAGPRRRHRQDQVALPAHAERPRSTTTACRRRCWSTCRTAARSSRSRPTATAAYALDRATGEFVWGMPFVKRVTWTKGLDDETGKPFEYDPTGRPDLPGRSPSRHGTARHDLPGQHGRQELAAHRLQPGPQALVHPGDRELQPITNEPAVPGRAFKPREFFTGGGPTHERITGSVTAIDVKTGKVAGKLERRSRSWAAYWRRPSSSSPASPRARSRRSTPRRWRSSGRSTPAAASTRRR